jgi:hypothetical protein
MFFGGWRREDFSGNSIRFVGAGGMFGAQFVHNSQQQWRTLGEIDAAAQTTPSRGRFIAGVDVR